MKYVLENYFRDGDAEQLVFLISSFGYHAKCAPSNSDLLYFGRKKNPVLKM